MRAIPDYRPIFLRLPFLIGFASYLLVLLGVLELGCRSLPTLHGFQEVPEGTDAKDSREVSPKTSLVHARRSLAPTIASLLTKPMTRQRVPSAVTSMPLWNWASDRHTKRQESVQGTRQVLTLTATRFYDGR